LKRSEINDRIKSSIEFLNQMQFKLPPWGYWPPAQWKGKKIKAREIVDNMLGWDLTDFGHGDFAKKGLILFTIRNGNLKKDKKTYAEKIMIADENQETPMHFHWKKMEDIINRVGGNLVIELYGSTKDEKLSDKPLQVKIDGMIRTIQPGGKVMLTPGESICLEPFVYHRFYGEPGKGKVMIGEVSMVNDDTSDNRFLEPQGRFPQIDEDEKPAFLLCNDYGKFL
jgi:D-lyxose ketol-isomerase